MAAMPDDDRPLTPAAVGVVTAAVRAGLACEANGDVAALPAAVLDAAPADEVLRAARRHRVTGLLTARARAIGLPEELAVPLRQGAMRDAALGLTLARETARAVTALTEAGVPTLAYKGVPLSLQTTGSLTARGGGDVDLLVRPEDVHRARSALVEAGWGAADDVMTEPGPLWAWVSYLRRETLFVGRPIDVDLHWRVGMHVRPLPSAADLLARRMDVEIAGTAVPTLPVSDALAAACMHAHLDRYARLRGIVDIVRLARRPDARLPAGASVGLRRLVGDGVGFANGLLGGIPEERLAALGVVPRTGRARERRLWQRASVARLWSESGVPLAELPIVYGERARYSGVGPSTLMLVSDFVLPVERLEPGMGPADVARAAGEELAEFVQHRILRRPH
jgi:hypothetical protein